MQITDIKNTKWRDELLTASFRGATFYCDAGSWEGGERVVEHEFPKKDLPYAEKMGRKAVELSVRGYMIAFPYDIDTLHRRDYRVARDALKLQLDSGDEGVLQLPGLDAIIVICQRYRLQEEDKLGGFCTFDMTFVEYGSTTLLPKPDPKAMLWNTANALRVQIKQVMAKRTPTKIVGPPRAGQIGPQP